MCEQCEYFEKQIAQYTRFLTHRFDPLTEARMRAALAELEKRKAELRVPRQHELREGAASVGGLYCPYLTPRVPIQIFRCPHSNCVH